MFLLGFAGLVLTGCEPLFTDYSPPPEKDPNCLEWSDKVDFYWKWNSKISVYYECARWKD